MEPGLLFCEEAGPVLSPVPQHDAPTTLTHGGGGCFFSTEGPSQHGCGNLTEVPLPPSSLFSHSCATSNSSSTKPAEPAPSVSSCCRDWMTMPFEFAISSQHKGHEEEGSEHSVKGWDEDRKKSCEDWIGQVYLFVNVHKLIRVCFTSLHVYCLHCRVTACTVAAPKHLEKIFYTKSACKYVFGPACNIICSSVLPLMYRHHTPFLNEDELIIRISIT